MTETLDPHPIEPVAAPTSEGMPHRRFRQPVKLAGKIALVVLLALTLLLLGAFVIVPRLMGWVSLTVLTGSMRPTLPPGSQIVVDRVETPTEVEAIRIGDVITFMPHPGDPTLVTHRVTEVHQLSDGGRSFGTRGDANPSPDPELVTATQIRGKLLYHVPLLGYLGTVVGGSTKHWLAMAGGGLLLGYSGWQLIGWLRSTGRHRTR